MKAGEKVEDKDIHIGDVLYESKEDNRRGAFAVWLTPKEPCFETASDDEIRLLLS